MVCYDQKRYEWGIFQGNIFKGAAQRERHSFSFPHREVPKVWVETERGIFGPSTFFASKRGKYRLPAS
jgi:hypothetical protein